MMNPQELIGTDAINHLKTLPINDITDLEDTTRWQFFFTKLNKDTKYTCEWIEERLLFYERGILDSVLRSYKVGLGFDHQDGKISMMMGGGFAEKSRDTLKENLNWKEGNTLVFIRIDDEMGEFQLINTSELNIIPAKPFTKEKEAEIINPLIDDVRSRITELRTLFDNGDFSVKTELETQQNELVALVKWTKEVTE